MPVKFGWIKFSWLSIMTCCQNSKTGRYRLTADSKLIDSIAPSPTYKLLCVSIYIHSVTRTPYPSLTPPPPATRVAKRRAQGKTSQIEQNGHWLADAKIYKNYISEKHVPGVEPGTRGFSTFDKELWFTSLNIRLPALTFQRQLLSTGVLISP